MRTYVALLALLAALATVISADPAEDARRAEMERAARKAAEDKKAAADEARREADARKSGEYARPVMVNNRAINPITGKVLGTFKGGSTYLPAMPGALDNQFWIHDASDNKITILVDANTCEPYAPIESPFTVEGKKLTRAKALHKGDHGDEGGRRGEPEILRGNTWTCELPARMKNEVQMWMCEYDDQLYVSYEGGVARISNLDGTLMWTSPGASGALYLWNDQLFCAGDAKICARATEKGDITWSHETAAAKDADIMHVHECALPGENKGQLVLCTRNGGATPATRWFTIDGKPLLSIDERAEQVFYGGTWTVLTPTRYAEIKRDGSAAWEIKRNNDAFDADAWLFTQSGPVRLQWGNIEDSGVKVTLFSSEGKPAWTHECEALGVPHSKYWHKVYAKVQDDKLVVVSQAAGGNFIETLTLSDGKQFTRHKP
ncbi:hypothetical protein PLCT2_00535 [Planctomycetaceae bacterium]|nr:hypothetical protein PLCT2_00535 [Planctomycetaceae bacterium]